MNDENHFFQRQPIIRPVKSIDEIRNRRFRPIAGNVFSPIAGKYVAPNKTPLNKGVSVVQIPVARLQ